MNYARAAFYAILAVCAIVLTVDVHRLMPKSAAALDSVTAIQKSTNDVVQATYASEGSVANLADSMNDVAQDLRKHEDAELEQAQDASAKLTLLLGHADEAVSKLGDTATETSASIAGIANSATEALAESTEMLKAGTADLADPSLKDALGKVNDSAGNLAVATGEAAGAMTDVHKVTTYELKQITAPVSKVKAIGLLVTRFVGKFFGF